MGKGKKNAPRQGVARWVFVAALALAALAFVLNVFFSELRPGNIWGLSYGISAAVLFLGALLWGWRRRTMSFASKRRWGSSRAWLSFHIYGGSLFLLLMLMHSGFRWPTGTLNWWLWALSLWVVTSGFIGLGLQRWLPRVLTSGLPVEVNYERIPELVEQVRVRAEEVALSACEPTRDLYRQRIEPALEAPRRRLGYFVDVTGGWGARQREFDYLRNLLGEDERQKLGQLEELYRSKLAMDAHYTLQAALRYWLFAHLPVSLGALGLLMLHIFSVLYY
ncbi:MAG: hypothetical protein K0U98_05540 [Deltaproteobacteria bacterium]|nr:hypothetical protein [Deltaproteobacteria bacterium]